MNKTTKQCLDLYRAVLLRGFSLKEIGTLTTHDGVAWHATLCKGKTKVLTAGNDGTGGPDWVQIRLPGDSRSAREAQAKVIIDELMDIPEVSASIRALDVWIARLSLEHGTEDAQEAAKVEREVQAINAAAARRNDDAIGALVGDLMDAAKLIASLKRVCKSSTVWFRTNEPIGSYMKLKRPETPALRQQILAKEGAKFEAFASDVVLGL